LTRRGYEYEIAHEAIRQAARRPPEVQAGCQNAVAVYDPCSDRRSPEDTKRALLNV
jgi:hypothetical protein